MKELEALHKKKFRYVVADAGYDGEENFAWLMGNNYISCIKPATHERSKTRKWGVSRVLCKSLFSMSYHSVP